MKTMKNRLALAIPAIIIVVAALTITLLDALIPLKLFKFPSESVSPLFTFIIFNFCCFGIMCIILGFINKSTWYFFLSGGLLAVSVFFIVAQFVIWWISLIIALVLAIIIGLLSYIDTDKKTEDIALNSKPEYKDYKERKAEKEAEEAKKEPQEMPEIKSFK